MANETKLIHTKMMDIMRDIDPIKKERQGQLKYKFRGIEDMYNTLQKLFVKHEVYSVPKILSFEKETIQKGDKYIFFRYYTVEYTFFAPDGSNVVISVPGEGMDYSGDKGTGKAMSNAHKYALIQIFMIPTEDNKDSDESDADEDIDRRKLEEKVIDYIAKANWPTAKAEAVIKGMKKHADDYLQGVLDGKLN
jgi:hypothetical protein